MRDPYNQQHIMFYDGEKKNSIRVYGNNRKNEHQFSIGWEIVNSNNQPYRIANKVGLETGFVIPDYTVITYKEMKEPQNKLACLAQKNLELDSKNNIIQQTIDENVKKFKLNKGMKEETNKQIQNILERQRRENKQHFKP